MTVARRRTCVVRARDKAATMTDYWATGFLLGVWCVNSLLITVWLLQELVA
jgi:hypothetical protein